MTFRRLLIDGLGSACLTFKLECEASGRGGGGIDSEADFFLRRKNEEGFLFSVGGAGDDGRRYVIEMIARAFLMRQ